MPFRIDLIKVILKKGITIGYGQMPDSGNHSIVACPVPQHQHLLQPNSWLGLRSVESGETLVEVSMAVSGSKPGKNVFGREIEPRKPIQTRLEARIGCALSAMGNRLIASREGILVIERQFQDRRAKDSSFCQPAKVIASIVVPELHEGEVNGQLTVHKPAIIRGTLKSGSLVHADSHLIIEGNIESKSQIDCLGSLRIVGDTSDANISAKEHLCITGAVSNSFISGDLTIQIDGTADNCTIYAREIIASDLKGGTAKAHSQSVNSTGQDSSQGSIEINYQKLLETQQREGTLAIQELREQMSIVHDLFGTEIVRQVSEENIQLMLLRWLREQKSRRMTSYSFREVQNYREILSIIPFIRKQLSAVGEELRDVTFLLDQSRQENGESGS